MNRPRHRDSHQCSGSGVSDRESARAIALEKGEEAISNVRSADLRGVDLDVHTRQRLLHLPEPLVCRVDELAIPRERAWASGWIDRYASQRDLEGDAKEYVVLQCVVGGSGSEQAVAA